MTAARKAVDPYRSAAALWGALARRYRDSYADRHLLPLSAEELAGRVGYSRQTIYAIEKGEHLPGDRQKAELWDKAVGADGVLLMLWPLVSQLGTTPLQDYLAGRERAYSETRRRNSSAQEEGRVERRQLLQLALAGLGAGPLLSASESVRQLLERVVDPVSAAETVVARELADWDLACADHMHAVLTRPAAQVIPDLVLDLLALERQLDQADDRTVVELQRFVARLSAIHANALTRLGDHGSALRWWRTARQAADASDDLDLRMSIRGSEGIFGLYGQRAADVVLRLTETAKELAGSRPSVGLARISGAHAQVLALLDRHEDACRELEVAKDLAGQITSRTGEFGWSPDGIHFTSSWVHSLAGDETQAEVAREHVMKTANPGAYQNAINVRLHEALAMVAAGGVDQGARKATEIIDGVPPAFRTHMIVETGRLVLRTVPLEHTERVAVRELHDVLNRTPKQLA